MVTAIAIEQRERRTMWGPGGNYTCFRYCAHRRCSDRRAQMHLPCAGCGRLIAVGERFVELEHDGTRVTKQAHVTCAEAAR